MGKSTTDKAAYEKIIDKLEISEKNREILKSDWLAYLVLLNDSAKKSWFRHNFLQMVVVALGLLIPVLEKSKLNIDLFEWNITVVSVFGVVIALTTAFARQFGFERKWVHYRKSAEIIRNEGVDFLSKAGVYKKNSDHEEAFVAFIDFLTSFRKQEADTYVTGEEKRHQSSAGPQGG